MGVRTTTKTPGSMMYDNVVATTLSRWHDIAVNARRLHGGKLRIVLHTQCAPQAGMDSAYSGSMIGQL